MKLCSFSRRLHNKGVYFKMGLRKMVNRRSCKDLHRNIVVEVDGKRIDLPPVEGIIILNILRCVRVRVCACVWSSYSTSSGACVCVCACVRVCVWCGMVIVLIIRRCVCVCLCVCVWSSYSTSSGVCACVCGHPTEHPCVRACVCVRACGHRTQHPQVRVCVWSSY